MFQYNKALLGGCLLAFCPVLITAGIDQKGDVGLHFEFLLEMMLRI